MGPFLVGAASALCLVGGLALWRYASSRDRDAAAATDGRRSAAIHPSAPLGVAPAPEGAAASVPRIEDLDSLDAAVREAVSAAVAEVERRPDLASAWGELGILYQAHRYFSLAERCLARARQLDAGAPEWPHLLGILAEERGDVEEAAALYREAIERAQSSAAAPAQVGAQMIAAATYRLGGVLLVAGDLDGAERAFAQLVASSPGEPWGPLGLGRVAQRRGSSAEAAHHLERALAADPANAQTAYLLATAYREAGRGEEARALVERARDGVDPTGPADPILDRVRSAGRGLQTLVQGANQALAAGNATAAEAIYLDVLRTDPGYYDALFNLGLLYGRQERFAESQATLERAVRARPESSQARLLLALSLASQDRLEEARAQLRELLERDPGHAEARAMLEEMER